MRVDFEEEHACKRIAALMAVPVIYSRLISSWLFIYRCFVCTKILKDIFLKSFTEL